MQVTPSFSKKNNCIDTTFFLTKVLGIKISWSTISKALYNHPNFPSLLSVSDILMTIDVKSTSIKIPLKKMIGFDTPFIGQIKIAHEAIENFTLIKSVTSDTVTYSHPNTLRWITISFNEFSKIWTGAALIINEVQNFEEKGFKEKRLKEKLSTIGKFALNLLVPMVLIFSSILNFIFFGTESLAYTILSLILCLGIGVGFLLLMYEVDQYNPLLKKVCSQNSSINCNAILTSDAAKIFGFSWSSIGFTYFLGGFLMLLITGISDSKTVLLITILNLFALPYTFYSIYYQWKIAKQWCTLCLIVQAILLIQFIFSILNNWFSFSKVGTVTFQNSITMIMCYVLPFIIVNGYIELHKRKKEEYYRKKELRRLKTDPQILNIILKKERKISHSTAGLGLILGNPDAKQNLIKVCNPYCGPCSDSHPIIENLLQMIPDLNVQIIFNTSPAKEDYRYLPTIHFLAIQESHGEEMLKDALRNWYAEDIKQYKQFYEKYPIIIDKDKYSQEVENMFNWCENENVDGTPTYFLNGYSIPNSYQLDDIRYCLLT